MCIRSSAGHLPTNIGKSPADDQNNIIHMNCYKARKINVFLDICIEISGF